MNRALLGGLVGFILVLASALTGYVVRDRLTAGPPVPAAARAVAGPALPETLQATFVGVAQQLGPAVVNIGTVHRSKARRPIAPQPAATIRSSRTSSSSSSARILPDSGRSSASPASGRASSSTSGDSSSPTST